MDAWVAKDIVGAMKDRIQRRGLGPDMDPHTCYFKAVIPSYFPTEWTLIQKTMR